MQINIVPALVGCGIESFKPLVSDSYDWAHFDPNGDPPGATRNMLAELELNSKEKTKFSSEFILKRNSVSYCISFGVQCILFYTLRSTCNPFLGVHDSDS